MRPKRAVSLLATLVVALWPKPSVAQCSSLGNVQVTNENHSDVPPTIYWIKDFRATGSMTCNQPGVNISVPTGQSYGYVRGDAWGEANNASPVYWCDYWEPFATTYVNGNGLQEIKAEWRNNRWNSSTEECEPTLREESGVNDTIGECVSAACCSGADACTNFGNRWIDYLCECMQSPLFLVLDGNWQNSLSGPEDGVPFSLNPGANPILVSWPHRGSRRVAMLVRDRNGNGMIDNGSELYGSATPQPTPAGQQRHGFTALAPEDANENGWVDEHDPAYSLMRVWFDVNHNGVSEPAELVTLEAAGILAVGVAYVSVEQRDRWGNIFAFMSNVQMQRNGRKSVARLFDVYPRTAPYSR